MLGGLLVSRLTMGTRQLDVFKSHDDKWIECVSLFLSWPDDH